MPNFEIVLKSEKLALKLGVKTNRKKYRMLMTNVISKTLVAVLADHQQPIFRPGWIRYYKVYGNHDKL
jgi:hypothetical protein